MKKIVLPLIILTAIILLIFNWLKPDVFIPHKLDELKAKYSEKEAPSVDHSKFAILKNKFDSPRDVTAACISCHTERHKEVMQSNHWNWEREEYIEGRGIVYLGKKNAINNFCIGVEGNEKSCAKCHIGYGMQNSKTFAYTDSTNIDCLICHDNSETYSKGSEEGGAPAASVDLNFVAQRVGEPKRSNCGVCHFYGGGGNNVKHGDLEESMFEPTKDIDIHMAVDGRNLVCTDCHHTDKHMISGKLYSLSSMNIDRVFCEDCHSATPHQDRILNNHTFKVACQTCHIPIYAKVNATKTSWDWSTAGKLENGEPMEIDDADGNHTYLSIKGSFEWGKKLKPEYTWFNGTASHYLLGDEIRDTTKPLILNRLGGEYKDPDSKIIPVKVHRAIQPYDPENRILIQPKLFADKKGEGAFWKDFDWQRAAELGMKDAGLPFSGKITFINTEMYWPINHMVSSKENSVQCNECHTSSNSRLASLTDFYMPARDSNTLVEYGGTALIFLSFFGVAIHGTLRTVSRKRNRERV